CARQLDGVLSPQALTAQFLGLLAIDLSYASRITAPAPNASEHALYFSSVVAREIPSHAEGVLWVGTRSRARPLPNVSDGTSGQSTHGKTIVGQLRKITDWRQKDGRQGADRRGSSPVE